LLVRLTRIVVETVLTFYAARAAQEGGLGAKTGAVTLVQRTASDLRLNPHLHLVVPDGQPGGGACASSRIELTRHPPVKGQRAGPGAAGVGLAPGMGRPEEAC